MPRESRPVPPRWKRAATRARRRTDRALEQTDRAARRAVQPSSPPTNPIPVWTTPDGIDRATAQGIVDLSARVGVSLLATGAPASEVVDRVLQIARAYGLRSIHVDVTFSSLTVSYHRGPEADPMTVLRIVRSRTTDFTRYMRLRRLFDRVASTTPPLEQVRAELGDVIDAPHPYRKWVVLAAQGLLGASAASLVGAGWLIALVTFATSTLIAVTQNRLAAAGFAPFFAQAVGAAIPTTVAVLITAMRSGELLLTLSPSLVVAGGIVLLLSGLSFVGAAQDAIEGFYVTASARFAEVVVLTSGIVVGIIAVIALANRLDVPLALSTRTLGDARPPLEVLAAAGVAGAFALSAFAVGRAIALSALAGGAAWGLYLVMGWLGAGAPAASMVAAFLVGFPAQLVARRLRVPALVVTTAAILPLVPGRLIYQGIFQLVTNPSQAGMGEGMATLIHAAGVGVGLAAGVTLGTSLARVAIQLRAGIRRRQGPGALRTG